MKLAKKKKMTFYAKYTYERAGMSARESSEFDVQHFPNGSVYIIVVHSDHLRHTLIHISR